MIMAVKPILFTILYLNLFIACNGLMSSTESGVTVSPPPQCEHLRDLRFGLIDQRVRVQYSSVGTGRGGTVGDPWIPGAHDTNPCITIYKERHTSATYFSTLVIQGGAGRRRGKPVLISVAFKELSTHQWTQETVLPTNIKSALSKTTIFLQEIYTSKAEALKICFPHASISGLLSVVLNVTACPGVDCGLPDNPTRGTVAFTTTDMGSVATYTCGHYVMVGPSTSTCQSDGDWSDAPSCISTVNCGLPEHPRRATVAFTTTTMGSITTYNCGHYVMVGPSTSTCQSDGHWSDAPSCIIDCGLPDNPTRGTVAFTTTDMGSVATYTCGHYVMVGPSTSTCQSDGDWSDAPSCISTVNCGLPEHPRRATVAFTTTTMGSITTYNCGHYVMVGPSTSTCQSDGHWSDAPSCIIDCGLPDNPTRGTVAFTTTDMGSVATYTCGHYVMVGPSTSTCQSDGDWSDAPSCIIDCGLPYIPTTTGTVAFTTTDMGSVATYNCGYYVMVGSSTSTCQSDGNWSDAPSCIIDCGLPDNPTRGTVAFTTTDMGSVATYTCGHYVMVGPSTSTCQSDGDWSDAPSCIIDCGLPYIPTTTGTVAFTTTDMGSVATYNCGYYVMVGSSTSTCQSDGNWSDAPSCINPA